MLLMSGLAIIIPQVLKFSTEKSHLQVYVSKLNLIQFSEIYGLLFAQHCCLYSKPQLSIESVPLSVPGEKETRTNGSNEPIYLDSGRTEWGGGKREWHLSLLLLPSGRCQ